MPKIRVGLDIGSTAVRAAEMTVGEVPTVLRAAQVPLPEGAVENGEVRQPDAVSDALGFQVQEFIPMPVEEAQLDFDLLGEFEHEGRRMVRILLVAAQKAMVNAIVDAATAARLDPLGLDLNPFALVRAVGTGDVGMDL